MSDTPRMRSAKKIYEDMLNEPTRPSAGHTSKAMGMADKMFAPVKKAKGGYVKAADGCAARGKTRGKLV
jgi:hypothetical protein